MTTRHAIVIGVVVVAAVLGLDKSLGQVGAGAGHAVVEEGEKGWAAKEMAQMGRLRAMEADYALAEGEVLRVVKAPFGEARAEWADVEYPGAQGSKNIRSLGFVWNGARLSRNYMSYVDQDLRETVDFLGFKWFEVRGLEKIKWKDVHGDFIVRESASRQEKLDALAELIKLETGQVVKFVKRTEKRPSIVLKSGTGSPGFEADENNTVVVLTQEAWSDALMKKWRRMTMSNNPPKGTHKSGDFQRAAKFLDAPFVEDPQQKRGELDQTGLFMIAPDAHLKRTDADFEQKLRRVLENVAEQVGGEWDVQEREVEVFEVGDVPKSPSS